MEETTDKRVLEQNILSKQNIKWDDRVFNLNTVSPYFVKEEGDYFGNLNYNFT